MHANGISDAFDRRFLTGRAPYQREFFGLRGPIKTNRLKTLQGFKDRQIALHGRVDFRT